MNLNKRDAGVSKNGKLTVAFLVAMMGVGQAAEQQGGGIDNNLAVVKAWTTTDEKTLLAAVEALGREGASASRGLRDLITCLDAQNPTIRQAVLSALSRIGDDAVGPMVELLKSPGRGDILTKKYVRTPSDCGQVLAAYGIEVLVGMDRQVQVETAIPALTALRADESSTGSARRNAHHALALMDPKLRDVHVVDDQAGPVVRPPVPDGQWQACTDNMAACWWVCYQIARGKPEESQVAGLVDAIRKNQSNLVRYLGMSLDRLGGDSGVPALLELLDDEDWYCRWAATAVLELMGDGAKAALGPLEKVFKDDQEDIDVRVGAARAIARIQGTDPFALYREIPNVEQRIIKATKDKSKARRQEFMLREGAGDFTEKAWANSARCIYSLATGQNVEVANAYIRDYIAANPGGGDFTVAMNLARILVMFHSQSSFSPGRLTPETEAAMKKWFFDLHMTQTNYCVKSAKERIRLASSDQSFHILDPANGPFRDSVRDYLTVSVLKDDPEYRDQKSAYGDTVGECYEAWNTYFRRAIKDWSLHGLWQELGSTNYEYRTYSALFNLVDLAPDPEVRQLARMWLDLSLIEIEQISIAGVRGGSKSRAKNEGLGSRFNPQLAMLYGQRGILTDQGQLANNAYEPPDAAILLRKLGLPVAAFEIADRYPGEEGQPQTFRLISHALNYAYCTPDYVIGCAMFDPNRKYWPSSEGRWSGVIFRDLAAISLDAYTGEKWNVQSKDVMIAQKFSGSYYIGRPSVSLTPGFEKVERDGWLFVSNDEAFAAINVVTGGYVWDGPVGYQTNEDLILLNDPYSPIILQTGRAVDYGSFANFQAAILKAPLELRYTPDDSRYDGQRLVKVDYAGPNSSRLEFFADRYNQPALHLNGPDLDKDPFVLPIIDGKELNLDLEYNYRSPYMEARVGSDVVFVRYGDRQWNFDFSKIMVSEVSN